MTRHEFRFICKLAGARRRQSDPSVGGKTFSKDHCSFWSATPGKEVRSKSCDNKSLESQEAIGQRLYWNYGNKSSITKQQCFRGKWLLAVKKIIMLQRKQKTAWLDQPTSAVIQKRSPDGRTCPSLQCKNKKTPSVRDKPVNSVDRHAGEQSAFVPVAASCSLQSTRVILESTEKRSREV